MTTNTLLIFLIGIVAYNGYIASKEAAHLRDVIRELRGKLDELENALYGVAYTIKHPTDKSVAHKWRP
jgi:hypothetical protein